MFHLRINKLVGFYKQNVWKTPVEEWHFFKHFTSKNQLPGFYVSGKLVENSVKD